MPGQEQLKNLVKSFKKTTTPPPGASLGTPEPAAGDAEDDVDADDFED